MEPVPVQTSPDDSPSTSRSAEASSQLFRSRPGLIVLTAIITELVLIGGGANQAITKVLTNYLSRNQLTVPDYTRGIIGAALTFHWRFAPANEPTHMWAAQWAAIGTLLLLTLAFGWVVGRGSVTFCRVWVEMAAVVAVATPLAIIVRNLLVVPERLGAQQSRIGSAVYGDMSSQPWLSSPANAFSWGSVIIAGLALGVLAGLFAAIFAVITRRRVVLAPVVADEFGGDDYSFNAYGVPAPGYQPPPWQESPSYDAGPPVIVPPAAAPTPYAFAPTPTPAVGTPAPSEGEQPGTADRPSRDEDSSSTQVIPVFRPDTDATQVIGTPVSARRESATAPSSGDPVPPAQVTPSAAPAAGQWPAAPVRPPLPPLPPLPDVSAGDTTDPPRPAAAAPPVASPAPTPPESVPVDSPTRVLPVIDELDIDDQLDLPERE